MDDTNPLAEVYLTRVIYEAGNWIILILAPCADNLVLLVRVEAKIFTKTMSDFYLSSVIGESVTCIKFNGCLHMATGKYIT